MTRTRSFRTHSGYTLIELVVSMAAASLLLAGMASTLFIALKASNPANTPAAKVLESSVCLSDMLAELQYVQSITETTATSFAVTVPDRGDADALPETIRYAWSSTAGLPLTRQYNGGAVTNILGSVQSLTLTAYPFPWAPEFLTVRIQRTADTRTTVESSTALLNMP